jgi:hypothetical protein
VIGTTSVSKTYRKFTPCGNIYTTITFKDDEPNRVDYIRISGCSKENECGGSWFETLADTLTFCVRRIRNTHEADAICKNLRQHRCNKIIPNREHITSCADAIGRVLEEVLKRPDEVSTKKL